MSPKEEPIGGLKLLLFAGTVMSALTVFLSGPARSQSCDTFTYDHNGSVMSVVDCGSTIQIFYDNPREGIRKAGVAPGVMLFDGTVSRSGTARAIRGNARVFRRNCLPALYPVEGVTASLGPNTITLEGQAPRRGQSGCDIVGFRPDTLVFTPLKVIPNTDNASDEKVQWATQPLWTTIDGGFAGEWQILDASGNQLGILTLDQTGRGSGQIALDRSGRGGTVIVRDTLDRARSIELRLEPKGQSVTADRQPRLLFERRGDGGQGVLFGLDGSRQMVTFRLVGNGNSENDATGLSEGDLPGFGIYAVEFEIVGVPPGVRLTLHREPDPASPMVGSVAVNERGIFAEECLPEIDNIAFEEATRARRAAMLRGAWCKVSNDRGETGYIPGRHLQPL